MAAKRERLGADVVSVGTGPAGRLTRTVVRPIVMNTQEQLREEFKELQQGMFLKEDKRR